MNCMHKQSLVNSPHKKSVMQTLIFYLMQVRISCWTNCGVQTPWRSRDVTVISRYREYHHWIPNRGCTGWPRLCHRRHLRWDVVWLHHLHWRADLHRYSQHDGGWHAIWEQQCRGKISVASYRSRESWSCCFHCCAVFDMYKYNRVYYGWTVVFVCLHITVSHNHHYTDFSESIEYIKCLSGIFCRVCLRLSLFSQVSVWFPSQWAGNVESFALTWFHSVIEMFIRI